MRQHLYAEDGPSNPRKYWQLVIIPGFIDDVLKAHHLPIERALDIMSLSRILSVDDVSFYLSINHFLFEKLPKSFQDTFNNFEFMESKYVMCDSGGMRPSDEDVQAFYRRVDKKVWHNSNMNRSQDMTFLSILPKDLSDKLISDGNDNAVLFDVFLIGDGKYGVRVKPADSQKPFNAQLLECYDRTLKVLCTDNRFTDVVVTSLFNQFIKLARQ